MQVSRSGIPSLFIGEPFHPLELGSQERIGPVFDPFGDLRIGRPTMGRVVLDAAVFRRIV